MNFLPDDYEVPQAESNYMKFKDGVNVFRIMSSPILGMEYWVDNKPIRKRMEEKIDISEVPEPDKIKHFWAMIVFDRADQRLKILEITQKSIMNALRALSQDEDWGDPKGTKGYDISVTREGEKLDTTYTVNPKPHKKLDEGIVQLFKDTEINLEALYSGDDPFETQHEKDIKEAFDE